MIMWVNRRDPLYDNDVDLITNMNKMLVNEQLSIDEIHDNDVDVITYMYKMLANEQISIHANNVLPLYLYDGNVS